MASVDAQLAQLQGQLNDLAKSMAAAQATGQTQALAMFKDQFRQLSAQAAALRTQANTSDRPSAFLAKLDQFSDAAIALGRKVGAPVDDLLHSTSLLLKLLPWLVVLAVAGVLYWAIKGNVKVKL
jgi:hypothetical protein